MSIKDICKKVSEMVPGAHAQTIYENDKFYIITMGLDGRNDVEDLVANGCLIDKKTGKFQFMPSNPLFASKINPTRGRLIWTA